MLKILLPILTSSKILCAFDLLTVVMKAPKSPLAKRLPPETRIPRSKIITYFFIN